MRKILLLGFLVLLFCVLAQGLVCNYCGTTNAVLCRQFPTFCEIEDGRNQCFSLSNYAENGTYTGTEYGCTKGLWGLGDCNRTVKTYDDILAFRCCTTDKCNTGHVPYPPPQCVKPTLGF